MSLKISYGAEGHIDMPLKLCKTVLDAREAATEGLHVPLGTRVRVNGEEVGDNHVLRDNDEIEFIKATGSKS